MKQSDELIAFTQAFYRAMETADKSFIRSLFSKEEALVIGTDPQEWIAGFEKTTKTVEAQAVEMKGISIVDANPQAFYEGDFGWMADQFKLKFPDNNALPIRITTVFHKEAEEWRVVQMHWSIGVPNEQSIGYALTIG